MGYNHHGFIHTESSCPIPAIPYPAHSHGWCGDRHGRHAWSHCTSLLPASLHNHSWCGQCRLHRHADFGWGWRSSALTKRRTGPSGHCAICALQRLQNGQFYSLSNFTCWLPVFSWTVLLYCSWTYNLLIHPPPLFFWKHKQEAFAGFASATDGHHGLEQIQIFQIGLYFKCSYMPSATF